MPARSVCLVPLSLSEAGPGRFGRQVSVTDIYHTIPYHTIPCSIRLDFPIMATLDPRGRFGRQVSVTGIYHTIPYRGMVWYGMVW